jgi:GAF domain-containing protein
MPFAAALQKSLQDREAEAPTEFLRGDSLEEVLNRHLMAVEQMAGNDAFTCVLLLSPDGRRLSYGAAPTVPASYCRASESIEIGPRSGSCGAAAYLGRPVYSVDIETDPIWGEYRDLALAHGFRSCWSTPIRNSTDAIIGTFAILHRAVGIPTLEEIKAIELITGHVADAIMWSRDPRYSKSLETHRSGAPPLRLVCGNHEVQEPTGRLLALARKLELNAGDLERFAVQAQTEAHAEDLRSAAELGRKLAADIMAKIECIKSLERRI